ncbi:MAG: CBS domain containing protein [Candidatus Methanohalarchaeum thermophilum]|uniref:CBS domain containing protein n=1 Tax=Methanohalarchaeum thermophilum TaxID=1903181 RepID=A0A1Q6DV16_METT1|nr:MAG: CBS domain containing protein [Candidatus Methanohalarchaeum thermophilum]
MNRNIKRNDTKFVKRSLDRGPVEFKTRIPEKESEIVKIGKKDVVTIPRSMTISGATNTMTEYGYRRLPVTDPGTEKLEGILTSMDIVRLMGGGDSYKLIKNSNSGNLYSGLNESVREIMSNEMIVVTSKESIQDTISKMISSGIGGIPIIEEDNKVIGIITERDIVGFISDIMAPEKVEEWMSKDLVTVDISANIKELSKKMVKGGFRRLPVKRDNKLAGIVTSTDILRYVGSGKIYQKLVTGKVEEALNVSVKEVMTSNVVTTREEETLHDVAEKMGSKNIGCLPVIKNGDLIGIITERDLIRSIIE